MMWFFQFAELCPYWTIHHFDKNSFQMHVNRNGKRFWITRRKTSISFIFSVVSKRKDYELFGSCLFATYYLSKYLFAFYKNCPTFATSFETKIDYKFLVTLRCTSIFNTVSTRYEHNLQLTICYSSVHNTPRWCRLFATKS